MPETALRVAYDARNKANDAHQKIEAHEELCAERYNNIHDKLGTITSLIGWGGGLVATTMLAVIGFLAVRVMDAPNVADERLKAQVEVLQRQAIEPAAKGGAR